MFLLGKKIRGVGIAEPLGPGIVLPVPIEDERLAQLSVRILAGDRTCIAEVVLGFARLAVNIAGQYATGSPGGVEDYLSEALLGACTACDKASRGQMLRGDLGSYIVCTMHSAICRYRHRDKLIPSRRAPKIINDLTAAMMRAAPPPFVAVDFADELATCIRGDVEQAIIDMRASYYVDREIGLELHLSTARVAAIRAGVEARYNKEKT